MNLMTHLDNKSQSINILFELYKDIEHGDLEYAYRGAFTQSITENILSLAETKFTEVNENTTLKGRIYFIMTEGLQNITRHQDVADNASEKTGFFVIRKKKHVYSITTGNLIEINKIEPLRTQIDHLNSLDKEELKQYRKHLLKEGRISDKGGAGLGLLEIARKSGSKLYYDFTPVNDRFSYFYLQTDINIGGTDHTIEQPPILSLDNIIQLHQLLIEEDILLSFKGTFTQEIVMSLLSLVENRIGESVIAIKVFNIMVEMIQNIVLHGDSNNGHVAQNPGIFFISRHGTEFSLTAGNRVGNLKIADLQQKVEYVNSLSYEELNKFYDLVLISSEPFSDNTGLGFIDMRLKSKKTLDYTFYRIDNESSLFMLQARI